MTIYAARHAAVAARGICFGQSNVPTLVSHDDAARAYAELEAEDPRFAAWMRAYRTSAPPGGERLDDLVARVREAYVALSAAPGDTLVVAHAGSIRALRAVARATPFAFDPVPYLVIEEIRSSRG